MDKKKEINQQKKNWAFTFHNAWNGCWYAFSTQKNFLIHALVSLFVLLLGLWLKISFEKYLLLIMAIFWGFTIEMANTVIEKIVDWITKDYHPQAKIIKDVSAGMMLLLSVGLALLGILILLPPLLNRLVR
ncbi:diacylglycerol kinase family protein [Patescibacteria group bacterium]